MYLMFATCLQNVNTLPCKIANNVRSHLAFCKSRVKHSDTITTTTTTRKTDTHIVRQTYTRGDENQ